MKPIRIVTSSEVAIMDCSSQGFKSACDCLYRELVRQAHCGSKSWRCGQLLPLKLFIVYFVCVTYIAWRDVRGEGSIWVSCCTILECYQCVRWFAENTKDIITENISVIIQWIICHLYNMLLWANYISLYHVILISLLHWN